jgi:hypothetical protein
MRDENGVLHTAESMICGRRAARDFWNAKTSREIQENAFFSHKTENIFFAALSSHHHSRLQRIRTRFCIHIRRRIRLFSPGSSPSHSPCRKYNLASLLSRTWAYLHTVFASTWSLWAFSLFRALLFYLSGLFPRLSFGTFALGFPAYPSIRTFPDLSCLSFRPSICPARCPQYGHCSASPGAHLFASSGLFLQTVLFG